MKPIIEKPASRHRPIFRPTAMSIALAKAGIINGLHMVEEKQRKPERI